MKKILYGIIVVCLILTALVFWHRSRFYAIGFFMPIDQENQKTNTLIYRGLYETLQLGLADAKSLKNVAVSQIIIPPDFNESIPTLKKSIFQFLTDHRRWWWDDKKLLIIAGVSSGQLQAAKETVRAMHRSVMCVSPGSTTPRAAEWPNVLQMVHNDEFAAQAIGMFIRRKQFDKAAIIYIHNDSYSHEYTTVLVKVLAQQEVPYKTFTLDRRSMLTVAAKEINTFLRASEKPVLIYTGFSPEIIAIEKVLDPHIALICTDTCNDLGDAFGPNRQATVVIPAIMDYTMTTRSVYERIFNIFEKSNHTFNYNLSFAVPFLYDFAYQTGNLIAQHFDLTWKSYAIKAQAAVPSAALESTWYTPKRNGPAHGGYWFIYTHDPKTSDLIAYRKQLFGNTDTLPQSAAVAYQIGHYAWAGLSGWNMYQNTWENYYLHGKSLGTKLSYSNYQATDGIINWAPFHVKKYRDARGKWWFASNILDSYPLEEKRYDLE